MDRETPDNDVELRALIGRVRRRWFRLVAVRTFGRGAAAAAVPLLVAFGLYRGLSVMGAPIALLALAPLASACAVGWVLWHMQRRPDAAHVARFVEERAATSGGAGTMDDALVSAVEMLDASPDDARAAFRPLIVADAVRRLRRLDLRQLIDPQTIRRAELEAAGGAALFAIALWVVAPVMSRAFDAARFRLFPGSVTVHVEPGDARIRVGLPIHIRAQVRGPHSSMTDVTPTLAIRTGDQVKAVAMVRTGDVFEYAAAALDRSFTYDVVAGAVRSARYTITALSAPRVRSIEVVYEYPAFTGLRPRSEEDGGDIYGPRGTRVTLRVHTDTPAAGGALALAPGDQLPLRAAAGGVLEADLLLASDSAYRVRLSDADGLTSTGDTEYFIRLMDDRPPDVRILRPSADQQITPLQEVMIEARADDDYGIAAFDLVYAVAGRREHVVPFERVSGTDVQKIGARLLPVEDLRVKPGDVITYYARARDVARGKRPTEASSDMFFLEVKPFGEEFVSAQSQASGGASGARIDSLIAAQKEIISATWNIERRSLGGRSADDVQAVARAQAELKGRVQQMRGGAGGGGGRAPAPERQAARPGSRRSSGEDLMGSAVQAMTLAQQVLEANRTKDALEHEMAALNALLQAQAEIRRREVVQQQSGSGGGGSGRSGEDLSALFDKELQRQQRTNYENRAQVEARPDRQQSGDAALQRIRDLARRQEDLNRRQRELAASGLTPEEIKRQLEKLTREQQELRDRADALSRQMNRGQEAGQPQRGQGGQPQASGELRQASEEMRSAMGELRRDDPRAAATRGERAAQQLRRAEEQMRGAGSVSGGDGQPLQVESQQIAQEQRRIAAEAERLEKSGGRTAADARQRLAAEKERLAQRVENLQRNAEQAARDKTKAGQAGVAAEVAQELAEQRVGQRMRDGSRQLRDGKSGTAQSEQQLARTLERMSDTLGGQTAGADGKRLSDQLERTRQIRDRLNAIEKQVREARADAEAGRGGPAKPGVRGPEGQRGSRGSSGDGRPGSDVQRLEQEYQRELQRARDALAQLGAEQRSGRGMSTPEQQEFSRSAPGTEAFKQDRSGWESLRRQVDLSLESFEAAASARLTRRDAGKALGAGGSQRTPDGYARMVARYFESLARQKK